MKHKNTFCIVALLLGITLAFNSCNNTNSKETTNDDNTSIKTQEDEGGVKVVLEMPTASLIKSLAGESAYDPVFIKALEKASEGEGNFVTLFGQAYKEIAPNGKLAKIFCWGLKNKINLNSTNEDVLKAIQDECDDAMHRSYEILKNRIDRFGVSRPNIQWISGTDQITIELYGVTDPVRLRKLLQSTAQLEFWETYQFPEIKEYFDQADKELADKYTDSLYSLLLPSMDVDGQPLSTACIGMAKISDTALINRMLAGKTISFPRDLQLAWTWKPNKENGMLELIALRKHSRMQYCVLGGEAIKDAFQDFDQYNRVEVNIEMNKEGAQEWQRITNDNIGRQIAIVLDDYVYSYPFVRDEVSAGRSSISGNMTIEEAQDLANILKAGKLPVPLRILEEEPMIPNSSK